MGSKVLEKIDMLRTKRNWSLYELAENAGIPQSTLSNMFARKTQPSISTLEKICEAFNISMSEFFLDGESAIKSYQSFIFVRQFMELSPLSQSALIAFLDTLNNK